MRYFITSLVIWIILSIFSRVGYDRIIDMVNQIVIPGMAISVILSMFTYVFLEKYIKNKKIFVIVFVLLIDASFYIREKYFRNQFYQHYGERDKLIARLDEFNTNLPNKINKYITLSEITLEGYDKIVYIYNLNSSYKMSKKDKNKFTTDECSKETIQKLLKDEYIFSHKFYFKNNDIVTSDSYILSTALLFSININPDECYNAL